MCGGGSKSNTPQFKNLKATPNPNGVADTSNDYTQQRAAAISSTDQSASSPQTFGSELGG